MRQVLCCWTGKRRFMLMFYKELRRVVRYPLNIPGIQDIFSRFDSSTVVAVETAKQGVTVGGDIVSGLMLADGPPWGHQKHPKNC